MFTGHELMIGAFGILVSMVGFFLIRLVKSVESAIEETKDEVIDLNNTLTEYIAKQGYLEKDIVENKSEVARCRERLHKHESKFNAISIEIERLKLSNEKNKENSNTL